jgi:CheY-like chemotaxis protein
MPHKLLLADDSITIQRVIELTFADEDVQVFAVGDGQKAIASIQSDRPDIVLADVGMPERDGYEVAEFIKSNPQLASIPVLLLTGAFEPIDETRARAAGCDGVLVKPFEPQMVINRVKDLLAGRRAGGLWGGKTAPVPPARETSATPSPAKEADPEPAAAGASAASASLEDYFDRLDAAFASVEAATEGHSVETAPARSSKAPAPADVLSASSSGLAKHDLEGWDPDLTGDPVRPEPTRPAVVLPPAPAAPAAPPIRFKPVTPPSPEPPVPAAEAVPVSKPPNPPVPIPFAAPAPTAVPVELAPVVAGAAPAPVLERREPAPQPPALSPASVAVAASVSAGAGTQASLPSLAEAFATLLSAEQGRSVSASKVGASSVSDQAIDEIVNRVIARMTDQSVRETVMVVAERLVREEIERIKLGQ